jgi:hypothetical protein
MSSLVMATLRDGSQVPQVTLVTTTMNLRAASEENFVALFDLAEKCKDASYRFVANSFGDSKSILKKWALIDGSEKVHDDVRKIVLNSIEGEGLSLKLVNPLQSARVAVVEKKTDSK